jgi:hypothetical protein
MRPILSAALALPLLLAGCSPGEPAQPSTGASSAPKANEPPPAEAISTTTPAAFQGEWNAELSACSGAANESRLIIGADTIRFYESQGEISATRLQADNRLAVEAMMRGEGESWADSRIFQLSEDGQTLTDVSEGSGGLVRRRCP